MSGDAYVGLSGIAGTVPEASAWDRLRASLPSMLGLVLLFAAISKSVDSATTSFAVQQVFGLEQIHAWRLVLIVAIAEAILGIALIFRFVPRTLSLVVLVALVGMTAFLVQLLRVDPEASCGCTILRVKLPGTNEVTTAIVRNTLLIALCVFIVLGRAPGRSAMLHRDVA